MDYENHRRNFSGLKRNLTYIMLAKEVVGWIQRGLCESVLYSYYCARKCSKWSAEERGELRPLFTKMVMEELLKRGYWKIVFVASRANVSNVMKHKSGLFFLSEDFPDLAEMILYSPLMAQLDAFFDSWNAKEPPFYDAQCFMSAFNERKQLATEYPHHVWWNMVDSVEFICGLPTWQAVVADCESRLKESLRLCHISKNELTEATAVLEKAENDLRLAHEYRMEESTGKVCRRRYHERLESAREDVARANDALQQIEKTLEQRHHEMLNVENELQESRPMLGNVTENVILLV